MRSNMFRRLVPRLAGTLCVLVGVVMLRAEATGIVQKLHVPLLISAGNLLTQSDPSSVLRESVSGSGCVDHRECGINQFCTGDGDAKTCKCLPYYEHVGDQCSAVDACKKEGVCGRNAVCSDGVGAAPTCTCEDGYFGYGDKCASTTGSPPDKEPEHEGSCQAGFTRVDGECYEYVSCREVGLSCHPTMSCIRPKDGQPRCECLPYFKRDGEMCSPYDTCADEQSPCDRNATCADGVGQKPTCTCNEGAYGYGSTCTPVGGGGGGSEGGSEGGCEGPGDCGHHVLTEYSFAPNSSVKLAVRQDLAGELTMKLGDCYTMFVDFTGTKPSHAKLHDKEVAFQGGSITSGSYLTALVHRDGDTLTTLLYTTPSGADMHTVSVQHPYEECIFSAIEVSSREIEELSHVSLWVSEDLEEVKAANDLAGTSAAK